MTAATKIEWADSTFNPWIGCTKISPACDHCYAEAQMDTRMGRVEWGAGKARSRTSPAYWKGVKGLVAYCFTLASKGQLS